jgi:hypothetical protein
LAIAIAIVVVAAFITFEMMLNRDRAEVAGQTTAATDHKTH